MGLDMFLWKMKKDEIAYWRKANAIHAWFSRLYEKENDRELGNCEDLHLTEENLIELRDVCKKVLASCNLVYKEVPVKEYDFDKKGYVERTRIMKVVEDPSIAEELLPTQSGFFYGSTFYDENYVEELENTIEQIDKVLKEVNMEEYDLVYSAWW